MDNSNPSIAVTRVNGEVVLHVPCEGVKLFFEVEGGALLIYEDSESGLELVSAYAHGTWAEVDFVGDDEE